LPRKNPSLSAKELNSLRVRLFFLQTEREG
jgi:hypothetical protein